MKWFVNLLDWNINEREIKGGKVQMKRPIVWLIHNSWLTYRNSEKLEFSGFSAVGNKKYKLGQWKKVEEKILLDKRPEKVRFKKRNSSTSKWHYPFLFESLKRIFFASITWKAVKITTLTLIRYFYQWFTIGRSIQPKQKLYSVSP